MSRTFRLLALALVAGLGLAAAPLGFVPEDSVFVKLLRSGQPESLLYVWTGDADAQQDDYIAVLDASPKSPTFGQLVGQGSAGSRRNEPHHFGYTADASRIFAAGMFTSQLFIFDVTADPRRPRLIRTVDLAETTGYTGPHSVYAVPDGVLIPMLGGRDGGPPGALVKLDDDGNLLEVLGDADPGVRRPEFMYDVAVKPELNRMITSSWAHTAHVTTGDLTPEHVGSEVAVWDFERGRVIQVVELDEAPLSVRWLNAATARGGFVNCIAGNSVWYWEERDGRMEFTRVLQLPEGSAPGDIRISPDDRFLYLSLFGANAVQQYDISDPLNPRLESSVTTPHPNMLKLSPDGRRLYVTNNGMSVLDPPDAKYRVRLVNVGPDGLALDDRFTVDFDALPTGQGRPHDMLFR